ncbi:hypothetical protein OOZ19_28505 [Saccharopolyspora sp. NFXS83]|nr:hypothetical protein [Saccharopolyspora sp. NFXS83]
MISFLPGRAGSCTSGLWNWAVTNGRCTVACCGAFDVLVDCLVEVPEPLDPLLWRVVPVLCRVALVWRVLLRPAALLRPPVPRPALPVLRPPVLCLPVLRVEPPLCVLVVRREPLVLCRVVVWEPEVLVREPDREEPEPRPWALLLDVRLPEPDFVPELVALVMSSSPVATHGNVHRKRR